MSFPRYPAYKPSGVEWLGEVPEHWSIKPLKHCIHRLGSGGTPESGNRDYWADNESDDSIPWVAIGDMSSANVVYSTAKSLTQAGVKEKNLEIFPAGSLLYSIYASLGKVSILGVDAAFNQAILAIVSNSDLVSQSFLKYWLESIEKHLSYYSSSNTQANLNAAKVLAYPVAIPHPDEQARIATFLDRETAKIDALIAEQQRLIELLQEKRQAVISHAVTKGLNPDAPMKDSGVEWLGEVPEHWDVAPLKHHWLVTDCKHVTAEFTQEGYPLASIKEVQGRWVDLDQAKRTTEAFFNLLTEGKRSPEPGDLVFSRNATVGEVAEVPVNIESFALGQDVVILKKLRIAQSSSYTWSLLRSAPIVNQLECAMIGSTFRRINVEQIKSLFIPVPPSQEQVSIAAHLDAISDQWAKQEQDAQQCISLLQERRSALISASVTGQIDVRGLVPEAEAA